MVYHSTAKWQRSCHELCLDTLKDGDVVIESDFIEKHPLEGKAIMTCEQTPTATMMVVIVHHSPKVYERGGRMHVTETWIFASEDSNHDFDFHRHDLREIAEYYLHGAGKAATAAYRADEDNLRTPRMHVFTNGCAKQYNGRRNFLFLADTMRMLGFLVDHHFAVTLHFKGCHDGISGVSKNAMKKAVCFGIVIESAAHVAQFLDSAFRNVSGEGENMGKYFATWSPYRIRRVHVKLVGPTDIYRPVVTLTGITGTAKLYHLTAEGPAGTKVPNPAEAPR